MTEEVHDSRRSSTAFRDQRFCLFKSRSSGLHLETWLDDWYVIVRPGIRDLMILRDSVNVVLNITNNQCPIRRTSFIFWNVEKFPWHKKVVMLLSRDTLLLMLWGNVWSGSWQKWRTNIRECSSKIYVTYVILFQDKLIPMQFHVKEHKRMCLLLISHHFHGMFGYVTN